MFALLAVLVMEMMLVRPGLDCRTACASSAVSTSPMAPRRAYCLTVGFARVFFGLKGPEYYFANIFFWVKIAAFLSSGLLSVPPTRRILTWRGRARTDPSFSPPADEIAVVRRYMHLEAMVFVLIPVFAALMARYSG